MESRLFFVCDICRVEEVPSHELSKKIADEKLEIGDFPLHCSEKMRLTILQKPVKNKEYSVDFASYLWAITNSVKVYYLKEKGEEDLAIPFEDEYSRLFSKYDDELDEIRVHKMGEVLDEAINNSVEEVDRANVQSIVQSLLCQMQKNILQRSPTIDRSSPVMPGSQPDQSIEFVCSVCMEVIDVDPNLREIVLSSDTEVELPLHHDRPLQVMIVSHGQEDPISSSPPVDQDDLFSSSQIEEMDVTSVGIDIGSSTSHLIFSRITLRREVGFLNMSNRFNIIRREVIYESQIIDTPLLDPSTIDIERVVDFCLNQYE
jgi:hypothetical protein